MWLLGSMTALATEPDEMQAIEELALADLLNTEVDVATRTTESAREAAGLVTVLTGDDLRRAGCLDLLDALKLLPAFQAATDTWNTAGLAVRGNWGFESKVLVLVDGHEWNETDYGTLTLGNRLPAYLIERIEVIRGPGSAVYGGYASLAVVKVTTRATGAIEGTRVDARASWLGTGAYGRQDLGLSGGWHLGKDTRLGLVATLGRGRRSDGIYRDFRGKTADLADASALDPALLGAELRSGGLSVAAMVERYHTTHRDGFGPVQRYDKDSDYNGVYTHASWEIPLGRAWTLTPRGSFKWQQPWHSLRHLSYWQSANQVQRTLGGVDLHGEPTEWLDLLVGGEGGVDRLLVPERQPHLWPEGGDNRKQILFGAGWVQGIVRTDPVNLTAGVRLDTNASYGNALSPRIAATRAWEHAHAKLQVSRAFRAPGFQQSAYDVQPENSTTVEGEVGVEPVPWAYLTGSLYEIRMTDALVYLVSTDPDTGEQTEGYTNVGTTGTRGGGLDVEIREHPLSLGAGWSAWTGAGLSEVEGDRYRVPGHPAAHLGLANHKGVVRASLDVGRALSLGATGIVLGPRWAITGWDPSLALVYTRLPATVALDVHAEAAGIAGSPFGLMVGVHDLLDQEIPLIQPFDGLHAELPTQGREVFVHLTGSF